MSTLKNPPNMWKIFCSCVPGVQHTSRPIMRGWKRIETTQCSRSHHWKATGRNFEKWRRGAGSSRFYRCSINYTCFHMFYWRSHAWVNSEILRNLSLTREPGNFVKKLTRGPVPPLALRKAPEDFLNENPVEKPSAQLLMRAAFRT